MSTTTLPTYAALQTPSYSAEPQAYEQRIAVAQCLRPRPSGDFVKKSKSGGISLRLIGQEENVTLPVYGSGVPVEGVVTLSKTDNLTSVEVKIEGRLVLKEIAEGGSTVSKLCLDTALLWSKERERYACPSALSFSLNLPATFTADNDTFPLPPTYEVHLSGLPGFTANIDYSVTVIANKPNSVPTPLVKRTSRLGVHIGHSVVSTHFIYHPRTRPALPLPSPMSLSREGLVETPEWRMFDSVMRARSGLKSDITCKLYLPSSRILCITQPIPFHLILESSPTSLAMIIPYGPNAGSPAKRHSQIKVMRQSTVNTLHTGVMAAKTDIWRVDIIGEGSFQRQGDGPNFISFSGEININPDMTIGGFKAAGLTVKDWVLFSINIPDATKSPFTDVRLTVPVRLTTDQWAPDGTGIGVGTRFAGSEYSIPSSPDEFANPDDQPQLGYAL